MFANDNILGNLIFDKDDDSWESRCLCLKSQYWRPGEKLNIRVEFVNDGGVAGERDASVAWIRFIPLLQAVSDQ